MLCFSLFRVICLKNTVSMALNVVIEVTIYSYWPEAGIEICIVFGLSLD